MTTPTGLLFNDPRAKPTSVAGLAQPGAYYQYYLTQTTTPATVYKDGALTTPAVQTPGTGDTTLAADGRMIPIYLNPAIIYRVQLYSAVGALLEDTDPYVVSVPLTAASIGAALYPQTPNEAANGVVPISLQFPEGAVNRYLTAAQILSVIAGTGQDCTTAIQNAVKVTTGDVIFNSGFYFQSAPVYITSGSVANLRYVGESRTSTYLLPLAHNIADANGINALIINAHANSKFSMANLRLSSTPVGAYDGKFYGWAIYSSLGTSLASGGYGTSQWLFSGSIDNCWCDFSGGGQAGFLLGGMSNYRISNNTFESLKVAAFNCSVTDASGSGTGLVFSSANDGYGEAIFSNNVYNNAYDQFILDTNGKSNQVTVSNLHLSNHNRGAGLVITGANNYAVDNISVQPNTGVNLAAGAGLATFTNCTDVTMTNFTAIGSNYAAGNPLGFGVCATGLTLSGTTGNFADGILDGIDAGIVLLGTSANRLYFDNVTSVNTTTASFRVLSGTPTGIVTANGCNWSDGQGNIVLFTSAGGFDFYLDACRIMNAGLGSIAGSRNLNLGNSGLTQLRNCTIGQNNVSAIAAFYFDGSSGTVLVVNPTWVGSPPTGYFTTAGTTYEFMGRAPLPTLPVVVSVAGAMTLPKYGRVFSITGTNDITSIPAAGWLGETVTLVFASAGAPNVTSGSNLFLTANFTATNAPHSSLTLSCDGTNWYEVGRKV